MADVYGNPYLPSFVRNQPKMTDPMAIPTASILPTRACQINSVSGFQGAHQHAGTLTSGSSEIVADSDPNSARIYIIAVDQNAQQYVQGFNLIPVEEPKPVTIDDLNDKMNKVLERLDQLEKVNTDDQSGHANAVQTKPAADVISPGSYDVLCGTGSNDNASGIVKVKSSDAGNAKSN